MQPVEVERNGPCLVHCWKCTEEIGLKVTAERSSEKDGLTKAEEKSPNAGVPIRFDGPHAQKYSQTDADKPSARNITGSHCYGDFARVGWGTVHLHMVPRGIHQGCKWPSLPGIETGLAICLGGMTRSPTGPGSPR